MNHQTPLTETNISTLVWISVLVSVFFGSITLYLGGYELLTTDVHLNEASPIGLFFVSFFGLFTLLGILAPFVTYRYYFFEDYFVRKFLLSRSEIKVYYNSINTYVTVYGQKTSHGNHLIIDTTSKKFKISSYGNNLELIDNILSKTIIEKRQKDLRIYNGKAKKRGG